MRRTIADSLGGLHSYAYDRAGRLTVIETPAVGRITLGQGRAIGEDGQAFSFRVTNEETGEVATVSEWAERVDQAVYDRVAADKQDNGLIDDDLFATKARGFLTIERAYPNLGQITRW